MNCHSCAGVPPAGLEKEAAHQLAAGMAALPGLFHALNGSSHLHRGFSPVIFGEGEDEAVSTALVEHGKPLKRFEVVPYRFAPG